MNWGDRPVIIVGEGCRGANVAALLDIGAPILTSWQALDLFDSDHPLVFGRTGLYGQRCANKVLFNADFVLSIGCRLSIWTVGYGDKPFAPNARIHVVDIDETEAKKKNISLPYEFLIEDAAEFIDSIRGVSLGDMDGMPAWLNQCDYWRSIYPWVESPAHDDTSYINSYRFMQRLNGLFKPDQVIVTDAGGACCSAFQVLRLRPPQRLMTSGGLGEMGCGIPAAIGASFARNKGEVICLVGDGAAMLNLQELQTIAHHQLPIKIIVFANDGYGMIKRTQEAAGYARVATDTRSGVSCPSFRLVAQAFQIGAVQIRTWEDFERVMPWFMGSDGPALCEVFIDPEQQFVPKLNPVRREDGTMGSPAFDTLSPLLENDLQIEAMKHES